MKFKNLTRTSRGRRAYEENLSQVKFVKTSRNWPDLVESMEGMRKVKVDGMRSFDG